MKNQPKFVWRQGSGWRDSHTQTAHAVKGCDPKATGWVAVCGIYVAGAQSNGPRCKNCERLVK